MRMLFNLLTAIVFLSLIDLPAPLAAADGVSPVFTAEFFKKQTQAGLAEMDDDRLIRNLTDLYGKFRTLNYPNCFECSLWLIQQSADTTSTKQLILAEYAARFSPDLPETHLNRFNAVLLNRPGDIGLMVSSISKYAITALRTPVRDAFIGALCHLAMLFAAALFIVMMLVMSVKYGRSLAHLYSHVGSFSLFHMVIGVVVMLAAVVLAFKRVIGLEIFFILWIFFCYRIMRYRELAALILLLGAYLAAGIWLDLIAHTSPRGESDAVALFQAVYDPPFAEKVTVDGNPAALFARGMQALYTGRPERADSLFESYAKQVSDHRRDALIDNLRGICAYQRGERDKARDLYSAALKKDERPEYLFNLSRALYSEGAIKEAEQLEMRAIAIAGRSNFDYPVIFLPRPYDFYREAAAITLPSGLMDDPLLRRAAGVLLLLLVATFLWSLGAARIAISRCIECGDIICEECGGTDDEVCLTCRVIKAGKNLVGFEEQRAHAQRREQWSAQRRTLSVAAAVLTPGAGLIYNDRIIEGLFYLVWWLFLLALFALPRFFSFVALSAPVPPLLPIIGGAFLLLIWLLSLLRTWRVAHNE